jgi:chromosome segregation ATPase
VFFKNEEENFKKKPKKVEEKLVESKIDTIMKRLETMTQQVDLISRYLSTVSTKVGKALDASVGYQRDLDDLERRINIIKSKMEELENVVPEIKLKDSVGEKAG